MTEFIYGNINPDTNLRIVQDADAGRRKQRSQYTGSEHVVNRCYRSVTVCLVLLCVLLLTAVIVLCVLINTNNQQFHIKNKNLTKENDGLLTNINNSKKQRDQLSKKIDRLWEIFNHTDGWIYKQSSFYFFSSEWKSWSESRRYCRERGADLIILNNKEEHDFVQKRSDKEYIWIGLTDIDVEGRWKWVDGSTPSYRFWRSGDPNGKREENCALSYYSEWYDYSCKIAYRWICELNISNEF